MGKAGIWIKAFRLRTLPLALSCTIMGSLLAWEIDALNLLVFIFALLTTLFLQILSNLANDYGDSVSGVDNEARVGPERVTQSGEVPQKQMKIMIGVFVALSFISGSLLIFVGLAHLPVYYVLLFYILGLGAILAALKYTIGKNPYGYAGLGDLFVYIFFGLVGVCGTFYLHTNSMNWWLLLPASSLGLLSTGVLNLNNMRDIENDANSGKHTLVVRLGSSRARLYHTTLLIFAITCSLVYVLLFYNSVFQFLFLVTLPFLMIHLKVVIRNRNPEALNPELRKLALLTLVFAITFGFGQMI